MGNRTNNNKGGEATKQRWIRVHAERIKNLPFDDLTRREKRQKILEEQNACCDICGNDSWNDQPITLELDHINGDRKNESRENLRFICPNCHAQTDTYKVGNNKTPGKKVYTDKEIIACLQDETFSSLYAVLKHLGMNPHGGHYERLRKLIKQEGITRFIF